MTSEKPSSWVRRPSVKLFLADIVPGLTTAAVVVPKALAYATIAGLPVEAGLFTALVPMAIYAVLGSSRLLSVSTTTPIAILCATAIGAALKADPGLDPMVAAATLSALVGVMLIAAGVLRLGFVSNFISEPVLTGFKSGVGIVIIADQLPKLLGIHIDKQGFFRDVAAIARHLPELSIPTVAVAAGTITVILLAKRLVPKAPAPLLAVAAGILASAAFGLADLGVKVVGHINGGLPSIEMPRLSLITDMWPAAAGVALIAFTESIAAARAFATGNDPPVRANRELLALGAANIGGALIGAMPAGGGTSQTAVNRKAGAQSQFASIVVSVAALATLLFLAPVLALMPQATLAAVVTVYSIGLVDPEELLAIRRIRTMEFRWALVACIGVMTLGTLKGIIVAIILSLVSLVRLANDPQVDELRRDPASRRFRPRSNDHPEDEAIPGLLIARPEGRLYFANAETVQGKLRAMVSSQSPGVALLDLSGVPGLEYTALKMLVDAEARLRQSGVALWLCGLNRETRDLVQKSALVEQDRAVRIFATVEEAASAFLDSGHEQHSGSAEH